VSQGRIATRSLRHWGGFVLSGSTAALVDAGLTGAMIHGLGADRLIARFLAILVAMVVAWWMHRRITFAVSARPSLAEFTRFVTVAGSANALNYAIYAGLLWAWPALWWLAALVAGTGIATIFAYLGFRLGVFRERPPIA
jgi:putative flippase GtrA